NAAHRAVAGLERSGAAAVRVITQNVDGLHQLAGMPARKVLELHGTVREVVCTDCSVRGSMADVLARVEAGEPDPPCEVCGGILKSATVMFGEPLDPVVLSEALAIAKACSVFLAVGSSLQVQPAAGLAGVAADHGARLVIVNAEPTPYDEIADEVVREPIGTALPALLRRIGAGGEPRGRRRRRRRQSEQARAPFEGQQRLLARQAAAVAGEAAGGADDPVAGDDDADGVAAVGEADGAGRLGAAE